MGAESHNADGSELMIEPSPLWTKFTSAHSGHPFLTIDPLLAIPPNVLHDVESRMPGLLTKDDREFEADLLRADPIGFAFQLPLGQATFDASARKQLGDEIRELWIESIADRMTISYADELSAEQARIDRSVLELQPAYIGWLILNPNYRSDVAVLRNSWQVQTAAMKRIPCLEDIPIRILPEAARLSGNYELQRLEHYPITREQELTLEQVRRFLTGDGELFLQKLADFYSKWELCGLRHWYLPIPTFPALPEVEGLPPARHANSSIPWYLTREIRLASKAALQMQSECSSPEHLRDWLNVRGKNAIGDRQYRRIERLHQIWFLALQPRYGGRSRFVRSELDEIFAKHLNSSQELIKKLRLMLTRALKLDE